MYDIYVRGKCQFLVTRRGSPIPAGLANGWKKKRAVRFVSDEIRKVVVREGFYARSQMSLTGRTPTDTALLAQPSD
jgi:hypothetical protein